MPNFLAHVFSIISRKGFQRAMVTDEKTEKLASLNTMFEAAGITHFSAEEVCAMRKAKNAIAIPPTDYWTRIIPALKLAEELRRVVGPLRVGNGYRPADYNKAVGGARNSQHLYFRALDLDLIERATVNQETFYEEACRIYLERGGDLKMGLGLYRPWRGTRIHIDTGYRKRYWKAKYVEPILEGLR